MANLKTTLFIALAFLCIGNNVAIGAEYPEKAVRIVVPFSAGGSTDILIRPIGQKMFNSPSEAFHEVMSIALRHGETAVALRQS